MKIALALVASLNGKTTNGDDPDIRKWTSTEDKKLFRNLINKHQLLVMGGGTYRAYKGRMKLEPNRLRIVMTRKPSRYINEVVPGQLEFTAEQPTELVNRLEAAGFKEMLLVSGEVINRLFFKAGLINELHLTIEPIIFGTGKNILAPLDLNVKLRLGSLTQLNEHGTLHLTYKVEE